MDQVEWYEENENIWEPMQDILMVRIVRETITIFSENKIDVIKYDDSIYWRNHKETRTS